MEDNFVSRRWFVRRYGGSLVTMVLAGALLAGAQPQEPVRYSMLEGTRLLRFGDMGAIERIPLRGTFDLTRNPNEDTFLVTHLRGFDEFGTERVTGDGTYMAGPATWSQHMILDVLIDGESCYLDSGEVPNDAGFPMIDVAVTQVVTTPDEPYYVLRLLGVPALPIWFSTEMSFTRPSGAVVSDGDVLTSLGAVLWTNQQLTAQLGIMPPTPDIGLDALYPVEIDDRLPWWEAWFSSEVSAFSEVLGPLSDGDLLSEGGFVVARNAELLMQFLPEPPEDYGLDAITWGWWCNGWYFSTEVDFWSWQMMDMVSHGDLLCEQDGWVVLRNAELLANFEPLEPLPDLGLDAVYMWPSGHIWFSLEEGFHDARYGWISDGDLLCRNGWVIKRNRELVARFEPLEDVDNFGLDALHLAPVQRGDMNGDGRINAFDIDPFVIALVDAEAYYALYPELIRDVVGDINYDGVMNVFDIDPFVQLLTSGG